MTEKEKLVKRLFADRSKRTTKFVVFPGEGNFTEEDLCRECNKAMDQVESGDFTVLDFNDSYFKGSLG